MTSDRKGKKTDDASVFLLHSPMIIFAGPFQQIVQRLPRYL